MASADSYREGAHHAERFRFEEARVALERAVSEGAGADALSLLAAVRGELGDTQGAAYALERALALRPDDPAIALQDATLLPTVYRDITDLERWRERYTQRLDAFVRDADRYRKDAARILGWSRTNFLLAYQGRNDVDLQRRLCEGLTGLLQVACPQFLEPRRRVRGSRIRVGFASTFLFDCTVGRYFASWIEGLDPQRFEVCSFLLGPTRDAFTERLAARCARFEHWALPVLDIASRLVDADLDVLIYPEVGMDPRVRLLSCLRLAPRQLAGWGHPQTTGSPVIDGFITCGEMEPEGAEAHYTEPLIRLPGLGVSYERPEIGAAFGRQAFSFTPDEHLYFCPHSLFKIHPDSDAMFADILARDAKGVLVLFQGQATNAAPARSVGERLAVALKARGVAPGRQVRVLPRMAPVEFRRVLQLADVVVDPLHWSGGNTALDAIAAGTPIVASPGALMRSRQAAAMLRGLGVAGLVAGDVAEAAHVAANVAADASLRRAMSQRIAEGRDRLFANPRSLERLAERL